MIKTQALTNIGYKLYFWFSVRLETKSINLTYFEKKYRYALFINLGYKLITYKLT